MIPRISDIIKQFETMKEKLGDVQVEFFWKPSDRAAVLNDIDTVSMRNILKKESGLFYIMIDKNPHDYYHLFPDKD